VQAEVTWTFETQGEKTKLTGHMVLPSNAVYEHVVKTHGTIDGAKQTLDRPGEKLMEMSGVKKTAAEVGQLEEPRLEHGRPMLIAGIKQRFTGATKKNIPALWQEFMPHIGNVPGQVGHVTYGLCLNMVAAPFSFDYMAGVAVPGNSSLPNGFNFVSVPAMRYAIFPHRGHVMNLPNTIDAIWNKWLPSSGQAFAQVGRDVPYMWERYGEAFDPVKMMGDIELWIPIKD
jgi:AraC family transcriptional regulator